VVGIGGMRIRLLREVDFNVDALVDTSRINTGVDLEESDNLDALLAEALSELRLVKDEWEVGELKKSVAATVNGFHEVVKVLPRAITHDRGERVVEGAWATTPSPPPATTRRSCTGSATTAR
jgi:Xaa-Pro aminopeptidase